MAYSGEGFLMFGVDGDGNAIPVEATPTVGTLSGGGTFSVSTPFGARSDIYTGLATGTTIAIPSGVKSYSIVVKGTGVAPTSWNVVLEGSLNNVNFTPILVHNTPDGDGVMISTATTLVPSLFFRSRCRALALGPATNIVVTILGMD